MLIGTAAYLPPEAIAGEREPDRHGDDYSFAVMAYEMLIGVLPFRGEGLSLLGQHGFATPRSPHEIHPRFPGPAADALLTGLLKDPERRLSAMALADALRGIPADAWAGVTPLPPEAPEIDATAFSPVTVPAGPRALPAPRSQSRRRRRRRGATVVAVAVAGLLGVTVAALTLTGDKALAVQEVSLSADATEGQCPAAVYLVTARIVTNGAAGRLSLRWSQPDGTRTDTTDVEVPEASAEVQAQLRFSVQGDTELTGQALLHVLTPTSLDSGPLTLTYSCPPG